MDDGRAAFKVFRFDDIAKAERASILKSGNLFQSPTVRTFGDLCLVDRKSLSDMNKMESVNRRIALELVIYSFAAVFMLQWSSKTNCIRISGFCSRRWVTVNSFVITTNPRRIWKRRAPAQEMGSLAFLEIA